MTDDTMSFVIYCTGSSEPAPVKRIKADDPFEILFMPIDKHKLFEALTSP